MEDLIKKVEAIVFAVGRLISEQEIATLAGTSASEVHSALTELKKQYGERESPLLLIQEGDGWKLNVGEKYLSLVQQISPHTELNRAILETLAVVAWKQPAKQSDVIKIRTNKAYEHLGELEKLGFINKVKYGRTYLLKVTGKFFDYFDLPKDRLKEVFKDVKDVEEAQTKLIDQEHVKGAGLDVYGQQEHKEEKAKEHLGELEVFEDVEAKEETSEEEPKKDVVKEFLDENKAEPAPQEVEAKEENKNKNEDERELDPELEEMTKEEK